MGSCLGAMCKQMLAYKSNVKACPPGVFPKVVSHWTYHAEPYSGRDF